MGLPIKTLREIQFEARNIPHLNEPFHYHQWTYPRLEVHLSKPLQLPHVFNGDPVQEAVNKAVEEFRSASDPEARERLLVDIYGGPGFVNREPGPGAYDEAGRWLVALGNPWFSWATLGRLDESRAQRGAPEGVAAWLELLCMAPKGWIHGVAAVMAWDQWRDGFTPHQLLNLGLEDNPDSELAGLVRERLAAGISGPGEPFIPLPGAFPNQAWRQVTIPAAGGGFEQI